MRNGETKQQENKVFKNRFSKLTLFGILGGLGGFAYYYFIGCTTNACPITSNPLISTGYGFGVGLLLGWDKKKSEKKEEGQ